MKMSKNLKIVFLLAVFIMGSFLRINNLKKGVEFNWDQERTAKIVYKMVKEKKPILIGPRVGPAKFFLPPGYYYLALPFLILSSFYPIGLWFLSALISIITGLLFYFLTKGIFDEKSAFLSLLFYLFSPFIVSFNRIPWNVNLLFLSILLSFYSMFKIFIDRSRDKKDFVLLGLGIGIGIQAHFTALFLILILLFLVLTKRTLPKKLLISLAVVLFLILPIAVFELRHDFLNLRQLVDFLQNNSSSLTDLNFQKRLWRNFKIAMELGGKIFLPQDFSFKSKAVFGFILFFYLLKEAYFPENKRKKTYRLIFLFFLISIFCFSFYKGPMPEYYFFFLMPLFLVLLADLLANVFKVFARPYFLLPVLFWLFVLLRTSYINTSKISSESLYFKQKAVDYIIGFADNRKFKINYIMETGRNVGFDYLFQIRGGRLDESAQKEYILVHPFIPEYEREYFVYYPEVPGENIEEYEQFGAYAVKIPKDRK